MHKTRRMAIANERFNKYKLEEEEEILKIKGNMKEKQESGTIIAVNLAPV